MIHIVLGSYLFAVEVPSSSAVRAVGLLICADTIALVYTSFIDWNERRKIELVPPPHG